MSNEEELDIKFPFPPTPVSTRERTIKVENVPIIDEATEFGDKIPPVKQESTHWECHTSKETPSIDLSIVKKEVQYE